jgi:hypothetical protein
MLKIRKPGRTVSCQSHQSHLLCSHKGFIHPSINGSETSRTMAIVTSSLCFFVLPSAYQEQAVHELGLVCLARSNRNTGCQDFPKLYLRYFGFFIWLVPVEFKNSTPAPTTASYILQASLT